MKAEIIACGTELLLGDLIDTNSAYLAQQLKALGLDLHFKATVGDNLERLTSAIRWAHERAEVVITSGGLGPTADDLTREAVARALGVELVFRQDLMDQIEARFRRHGFPMTANNRNQAYIPQGALPIENPKGTAPAFVAEDDRGVIISLPGVPHELKFLTETRVVPYLRERFGLKDLIRTRVLRTCALGESYVDETIQDLITSSKNPTIGLLAHPGQVDVRITAKGKGEDEVERLLAEMERKVRGRLEDAIYGTGEQTLEDVVGALLKRRGETLALLETNTGGALANRLTGVSGSGEFFKAAWVLYSSSALAGLFPELELSELSEVAAGRLARRVAEVSGARLGLAILGRVAGEASPTEAEETYFALSTSSGLFRYRRRFGGEERFLQVRASTVGLDLIRRHLEGRPLAPSLVTR